MRASWAIRMPAWLRQRRPLPPPAPLLRAAPDWRWTVRQPGSATLWAGSSGGMARRSWSRLDGWPSEGSPCHTRSEEWKREKGSISCCAPPQFNHSHPVSRGQLQNFCPWSPNYTLRNTQTHRQLMLLLVLLKPGWKLFYSPLRFVKSNNDSFLTLCYNFNFYILCKALYCFTALNK